MTAKSQILIVEDEKDVRDFMLLQLKRDGLVGTGVDNGEDALKLLHQQPFDLAVLDWMLPGMSGLDLCKKIYGKLPILMVTARSDVSDIVLGLASGADDYVTKPFEIPVFLARVHALLRRATAMKEPKEATQLQIGELVLDSDTYVVRCAAEPIELTPTEFKLLAALMKNQGRVLSRDKLVEAIQGQNMSVGDRTIDTHVFGLRKKLGACAEVIETIRGIGYRIQGT